MRAVLFCMDAEGKAYADPFDGPGAIQSARAYKASVEPDFPGAVFSIWADMEAREDYARHMFGPYMGIAT